MWTKSENSRPVKPESVERSGNMVIVRKGFRMIEATEEREAHYEWDEWQMTAEQYEVYETFKVQVDEQADALVELAGLISEVI